jgi:hypothetical protein
MLTAHRRIHYVPIDGDGIRCGSVSCPETGRHGEYRRCQMRAEIPPDSQTQSAISNQTIYDP